MSRDRDGKQCCPSCGVLLYKSMTESILEQILAILSVSWRIHFLWSSLDRHQNPKYQHLRRPPISKRHERLPRSSCEARGVAFDASNELAWLLSHCPYLCDGLET